MRRGLVRYLADAVVPEGTGMWIPRLMDAIVSVAIAVAVGLLLWLLGLDGASWGRGAVVSQ